MELPKETLDRIEKEASAYCYEKPSVIAFYFNEGYNAGAKSEVLRSLNEIEKLNNQALHFQTLAAKYQGEMRGLESSNKKLNEENMRLNKDLNFIRQKIDEAEKELRNAQHSRIHHESKNKELMEALKHLYLMASHYRDSIMIFAGIQVHAPTHIEAKVKIAGEKSERLQKRYDELKIESLLKSLPNKEA